MRRRTLTAQPRRRAPRRLVPHVIHAGRSRKVDASAHTSWRISFHPTNGDGLIHLIAGLASRINRDLILKGTKEERKYYRFSIYDIDI